MVDHLSPMRINPTNSSTIPFHIAKAYGVNANAQASRVQPARPASSVDATQNVQSIDTPRQSLSQAGQSLVAGVVPGRVDFSGETPQPSQVPQSLQFYRHPADKNAAATSVLLGKRLDING